MTEVLVYRGWGENGLGVYGHVLGTDYTYEISYFDVEYSGFGQAGTGFVFRANDTNGFDNGLVYSDGSGQTVILYDENGNIIDEPTAFVQFGSETVFLGSTDSVNGGYPSRTLLMTNGDGAPEVLLPESVDYFTYAAGAIWARTSDGDLYRIAQDGSYSLIYNDSAPGNNLDIDAIFEFNGALYIRGDVNLQNDLYRVDPLSGTITELNIAENGGADDFRLLYAGIGENLFYYWQNSSAYGIELYVSDGTPAGTSFVEDIWSGTIGSYYGSTAPQAVGDLLFFAADDGGVDDNELWISDGTAAGTFALTGTGSNVGALNFTSSRMFAFGSQLLFSAQSALGYELYITDGTIAGTHLLADLNPGSSSSEPQFWLGHDGLVYFTILSGPDDEAVWVTDGTASGTYVVSDPDPDNGSYDPFGLTVIELDVNEIPVRVDTGNFGADLLEGFDIRDHLMGEGGDDILRGFGADDLLDGGTGNDSMDGGSGNDRIVYDAADNAANVTGGAGIDTLWVLGGVVPLGYDLVAGSFEFAQHEQTDGSGQFWSTITDTYNQSWQQVNQNGIADDFRTWFTNFDVGNSEWWSTVTQWYNPASQLQYVNYTRTDGSYIIENRDFDNTQWWNTFSNHYNTSGQNFLTEGNADDGRYWVASFDVNTTEWWSYYTLWFDTADANTRQLINVEGIVDDGRSWTTTYDVDDLYTWSEQTVWYDTNGDIDFIVTV